MMLMKVMTHDGKCFYLINPKSCNWGAVSIENVDDSQWEVGMSEDVCL